MTVCEHLSSEFLLIRQQSCQTTVTPMTIFSVLAFENSLNSAISFATRSLVPGFNRKNTAAAPVTGTGLLDHEPEEKDIFCNDGVVKPNTRLALELHYHLHYVKAKNRKTQLDPQGTSRFIEATRAFPEDGESEFPLLYNRAIPVSLYLSRMGVDCNKEAQGLGRVRADLYYSEIYDYRYPHFEKGETEEAGSVFHYLVPPALPLFPISFIPFSQENIRSNLANLTQNAYTWFLSEHTRGYRGRKGTSLAHVGLRWKEMQIAQCASACSQRLLGKMGTGWRRLEIDDNNGERPLTPTLQSSINGRNGHIDGALEMHRREESGTSEVGGASPKLGGYGGLANLSTERDGKLQMGSTRDIRETASPQNLQRQPISGKCQTITATAHTGSPRRRHRPINIDWGTPKWSSQDTVASESRSSDHFKSGEKRLVEDLPPLSSQVFPRTVPSSPIETSNPSSTLWQHTLQVDIGMPMAATTYESPRPAPTSPPPRRSSLECRNSKLTKMNKESTFRGKFNAKLRSRQTSRRTSSLDFACRGSIARASVFSEDIYPGCKKTQADTENTWTPGNTIRKTRKAVVRALASTGLIGWRERERDDNEEWRALQEGSIRHKLGRTRKLKPPEDSYLTPPPSPHPGNRVYISGSSSTGASAAMNVRGTREVQAAEAEVEVKLKRKRMSGYMRLIGK